MNSITRLSIVPFLILCISVLGCAVFPGQQEEVTFPRKQEQSSAKQEQSSAKIIMPTDDQPVQIQSGQSADEQKLSAVFRGLPSLTNESFDSQFSTQQNPSLVPDGLLSNEATFEPDRHEPMVQADRIEFAQDNVPFGNRIRMASHLSNHKNVVEGDEPVQPAEPTAGGAPAEGNLTVKFFPASSKNSGSTPMELAPAIVPKKLDELKISDGSKAPDNVSWIVEDGDKVYVKSRTINIAFEIPDTDTVTTWIQITTDDQKYVDSTGNLQAILENNKIPGDGRLPKAESNDPGYLVNLDPDRATIFTIRGFNNADPKVPTIQPYRVTIKPPSDSSIKPEINAIANGIYANDVPFDSTKSIPPIKVYGPAPYLRISGRFGNEGNLRFLLTDGNGVKKQWVAPTKVKTHGSYGWEAVLNLPSVEPITEQNSPGRILVYKGPTASDPSHSYATGAVQFLRTNFMDENLKPEFTTVGEKADGPYYFNQTEIALEGTPNIPADAQVVVTSNLDLSNPLMVARTAGANWSGTAKELRDRTQRITARFWQGDKDFPPSDEIEVTVSQRGPTVTAVNPPNFGIAPGIVNLTITFDRYNKIAVTSAKDPVETNTNYYLLARDRNGAFGGDKKHPKADAVNFDAGQNSVTLTFNSADIPANVYQLNILGADIEDVFGNKLVGVPGEPGSDYKRQLGGPAGALVGQFVPDVTPTVGPAIGEDTGDYVAFPEYVKRPDVDSGFNPNDKVETRVVRLYYYRDAHRIAQIVNRKVESYNRAAVKTNRRLADKARNQANQLTVSRQNAERNAIIMANKTRQQESELQRAENSLNGALRELTNYRRGNPDANPNDDDTIKQLESLVNSFSLQVSNLQSAVQNSRDQEVQANEQAQQAEAQEKLAREDQFRREVAAAHSDPDTYAPGKITSVDPVEQVSVSVVGEGLIQLRGPLKGINLIRTAIDQLDSPVGQVRISLHTIQINGEHADRMEVVAKKVQTYIDHARFLTMQSSEMLRKAVVQVASQKAEEASALFPGATQQDRDERYIMAFFGKDFIDELKAMDSEFLHTGNKLLSLHSMDTTSLASALNLMALAKNGTRQEIFAVFDGMCQTQLPQAEQNYFAAGWTCPKKKKKHLFHRCKDCEPEYCPMACNARFESLRGFFDMQISNDETMTPLQREFIRLAQIFKSRLVTELEYKQRVMERALIEERLGNRNQELVAAKRREEEANTALANLQNGTIDERVNLIKLVKQVDQELQTEVYRKLQDTAAKSNVFNVMYQELLEGNKKSGEIEIASVGTVTYGLEGKKLINFMDQTGKDKIIQAFVDLRTEGQQLLELLDQIATVQNNNTFETQLKQLRSYLFATNPDDGLSQLTFVKPKKGQPGQEYKISATKFKVVSNVDKFLKEFANPTTIPGPANQLLDGLSDLLSTKLSVILSQLSSNESKNVDLAYRNWFGMKQDILFPLVRKVYPDSTEKQNAVSTRFDSIDDGFAKMLGYGVRLQIAESKAQKSRRPLDHKKFLDMLVDDLEEKYIELLDGTRAQVANIDNYLKRVTTALDDDFNTQFYYPAFKYVREANVSYDVQFGQFETTTLLANNREFAKADPSATMEFDLPKRDILLKEGIDGAKAMMNDVGALASDPSFLAMAKLNSPNSGASPNPGSTGGDGMVRNVLPGLGGSTDEQVMSQNSNGGQQFGSNLENLIPDPAIYKFETGTGFEIRPVIQPDGQAVVFDFNYMYSTEVREPVRADEKHLGRVKRHYVDTDVQLSNFELREVSRYTVALKAARTAKGVPLFEDIPGVGVLFRPLPSDENSLQQNLIMAQATIFPTLFDLMGLRWASVVSDLDPMALSTSDFIVRNRRRMLENRVYDESSAHVDDFLRVPEGERRMDLYRSQETIPYIHPNGYTGPGMNLQDSQLQEGYQPNRTYPAQPFVPTQSIEGSPIRSQRRPSDDWYFQNGTSASPDPNGIRGPGAITPLRGR